MGETALLGSSIPPNTPHAISVSLPTWKDTVGYERGEKRVIDSMVSGYPRFFIHPIIQKLASICERKHAIGDERCMLFPTQKIADQARAFIQRRSLASGLSVNPRLVHLLICPEDKQDGTKVDRSSIGGSCADLHIILFPSSIFSVAKEFWQHTGLGISSRLAEKCLTLLPIQAEPQQPLTPPTSPIRNRYGATQKGINGRYSTSKGSVIKNTSSPPLAVTADDEVTADHVSYLEERYGRNLPLSEADLAKRALRLRVAGTLARDSLAPTDNTVVSKTELVVGPSTRVKGATADDVYLYPSGMSAIWNAHNLALNIKPEGKSVCFGFPYTDTLKILQKWGPGCHFLGHGLDSDIDELEQILDSESALDPSKPPILALFTEFPSNPLLRSADLPRLRKLADKYNFLIVVDETIGNFVNVEVLPHADIVVSSLTKIFSGVANVMGGSMILNPQGRHYAAMKAYQAANFEDVYFNEDAIYLERNSRDFKHRIRVIDRSAEAICDLLRARSVEASDTPSENFAIKQVFYPKFVTREHYDKCRISTVDPVDGEVGGFGGLFSLTFVSIAASRAFFDALECYKGPSLGTNFTLACPFTILAHFTELEWAGKFGVEEGLVRVSVGLEETEVLVGWFKKALAAAEAAILS